MPTRIVEDGLPTRSLGTSEEPSEKFQNRELHSKLQARQSQSHAHFVTETSCQGFRNSNVPEPSKHKSPRDHCWSRGRCVLEGSGDDRLSRVKHYHGPGGLNGRVRDGNGWNPASIVAGKLSEGVQTLRVSVVPILGHTIKVSGQIVWSGLSSRHRPFCRSRVVATESLSIEPTRTAAVPVKGCGGGSGWSSSWLLGPVGCDGRPSCTPGLSTWSSSRSLRK